jgi:(1->4)-alpha-D-glucan 1-alpha-D-glucosylmutase
MEPDMLHQWMLDRRTRWPAALSATGTHDTKRGEDVRARINAISELPGEWKTAVSRWRSLNRRLKIDVNGVSAPDPNEEYFIYQVLLGHWPFDPAEEAAFADRLKKYLTKALREAKVHTSWLTPDEAYEHAVLSFVDAMLSARRPFLDQFRVFQRRVVEIGIVNSLAQLLIKCTAPGVPDFYQGTELWDLSFVDPDNRRPVDYASRISLLDDLARRAAKPELAGDLLASRHDGRVKLFTMVRALAARRDLRELFLNGEYVPLRTAGTYAAHVFAFARTSGSEVAITCVPRLVASLPGRCAASPPLGRECWADTAVVLPCAFGSPDLVNAFTAQQLAPAAPADDGLRIDIGDLFAHFPVALLTSGTRQVR